MACRQFLGAFVSTRWLSSRLLRVQDAVNCATFSRTGGGKGVSVVLPNLLSCPSSMVVIDPKCENFFKTAKRRQQMGHKIVRLDPLQLGGGGAASFNPLDFIDANAPDFRDQCQDLASMLVVRQGSEPDPFWNNSSELVLTALTAFVCACEPDPAERNFDTVRMIVSDREKFTTAVEVMRQVENPVVRRMGGQLTWLVERELGSVLSNVQTHTAWADSPAVAACFKSSDFDPRELRRGNVTVYLVVPPDRLGSTWAPLIRVWIGSFLKILIREGADERRKVLFMLDEVAQLGRMQALEDAVSIVRGYGIRLWFIFQSLKQVEDCYGKKAGVILDNIATWQFFALGGALETAEMIARRVGDETIQVTSPNSGGSSGSGTSTGQPGESRNRSTSWGMSTSMLGRKLLLPDEILRLPEDLALIFHRNLPVIAARLVKHYNAPEFRRGRKGKQGGIGLAAGMVAACLLAVAGVVASFCNELPLAGTSAQRGFAGANVSSPWQAQVHDAWQSGVYQMFPEQEPMRYRQAGPYRRPLPSRRRTTFGDLIPIQ